MSPNVRIEVREDGRADRLALVDSRTGETVDYQELVSRVRRVGSALQTHGVSAGDRVVVVSRNSFDHVIAWYGGLHAGAIVVDVNILLGAEELHHVLADAQPALVLHDESIELATMTLRAHSVHPMHLWQETTAELDAVARRADDPAIIAYTSGTTGLPKGVVHTHRSVVAQLELLRSSCGYSESWSTYVATPLFAMHGFLSQVAATLHVGGTVIIDDKFDPRRLAEASRSHAITYTTLSSPMLPRILELPPDDRPDLSHLRLISCGGAPLAPEVRDEFEAVFDVHLTQGYASTEVLGAFVMDIDGTAPRGAAGPVYPRQPDVVRILDEAGNPLPADVAGEIAFRREFTMSAYWQRPAETAAAFDGDWYRTGDLGRIDVDGYYYIVDRKKDVVIRGGFNIYSAEIERVLVEHPDVREATVVGAPDPRLGEVPVAFVVPSRSGVDADVLLSYAGERLGRLKKATAVHLVEYDELPRNGLGKVQKAVLRARLSESSRASDATSLG